MIIDALDFLILISGCTFAGGMLAFNAGISKGCDISQASVERAANAFARDNGATIALGKAMIDVLKRHAAARGFAGSELEITTQMNWDHAGRTYTFTLKEADHLEGRAN
jgi:2-polyprenyl-6-methoxyphenol hydroxylase-like FAD-dependent oxidoreductase